MRRVLLFLLLCCASAAAAQTCTQATSPPSVQLSTGTGITINGTTATYIDTVGIVDGGVYAYVVTANDIAGQACSNIVLNVTIPSSGVHTVTLTWTTSTTPGVTYAVFRTAPPLAPSGLTATVN